MIELHITYTCRGFRKDDDWKSYGTNTERFASLPEAKKWLTKQYAKCKRSKMYRDTANGTIHCGYIYSYRDFYDPSFKHIEQHWIEFRKFVVMDLSRKGE